jgi:hypothetical protein
MTTQLIVAWVIFIIVGLAIDIGIYLFLRADWKKNGVVRTDLWLDNIFGKIGQIGKAVQHRISASLVQYYREALPTLKPATVPGSASALGADSNPESDSELVADATPVEIIPISVENVGQMRHIEFSIDLRLDTQVDVRIGATNEAGVTVEKREL